MKYTLLVILVLAAVTSSIRLKTSTKLTIENFDKTKCKGTRPGISAQWCYSNCCVASIGKPDIVEKCNVHPACNPDDNVHAVCNCKQSEPEPEPTDTFKKAVEFGRVHTNQRQGKLHTVKFEKEYKKPVVFAHLNSFNGSHPSHIRIVEVEKDRFSFEIEEWTYTRQNHKYEDISWMVADEGTHDIGDCGELQVGTTEANHKDQKISFASAFSAIPVVISQAQTRRGGHPVVTRNFKINKAGFSAQLEEQESQGWHKYETVGYFAIVAKDCPSVEAAIDDEEHDHHWGGIDFKSDVEGPLFVDMQSRNGHDTAAIRMNDYDGDSVEVKVEEEQSKDCEVKHVGEDVGYVKINAEAPIKIIE